MKNYPAPGSYILKPICINDFMHNMQVLAQDAFRLNRYDPYNAPKGAPERCDVLAGGSSYDAIFGAIVPWSVHAFPSLRDEFILSGLNTPSSDISWWEHPKEVISLFLLFYIEYLKLSHSPAVRKKSFVLP